MSDLDWPENDPTVHPFGDCLTTDLPSCAPPRPYYDGPHDVSPSRRNLSSGTWSRVCCCGATAYGLTPGEATAAATDHLAAGEKHRTVTAAGPLASSYPAAPDGPVGRLAGLLAGDPTVKGAATGEGP